MPLIEVATKFNVQPQYPAKIDQSTIARNANFFFNPGGSTVDLANTRGRVWTPNGNAKIIATPHGQAFNFDGAGSYLSYTGYSDLSGNVGTLALWFSRVGAPSTFGHVYFGDSPGFFLIDNNGKVYAWGNGGSSGLLSSWFNTVNRSLIFVSKDGTAAGLKIYVDGVDSGLTFATNPVAFSTSSKSLNLGSYVGGSSWDVDASLVSAVYLPTPILAEDAKAFHTHRGWDYLLSPPELVNVTVGGAPTPTSVFVKVAGVWRSATPYVKVAGVWKASTPSVKVTGTWK